MLVAPAFLTSDAGAQATRLRLGAHVTGAGTHVDPAIVGESRTEAYAVHPILSAHISTLHGRATVQAMLNLEGWTLDRGALAPGNAGEGYVDRRHPHTFLHEAIATIDLLSGESEATLSAGRGFVPFGTDDPMVRPFLVYPANHHWAQVLERIVVIAAFRRGAVTLEAATFNGDEPNRPSDLGRLTRLGDSKALRLTLRPRPALELQASIADVASPEHPRGGGLDQRKWSTSARWTGDLGGAGRVYGLVEWAETRESSGGRLAYIFTSVLAEAELTRGPWRAAARYERTTRPEEERLFDPFRSARPHGDENIIGATRWNTVTVMTARALPLRGLLLEPFIEAAYSGVREITGAIFDPVEFYGSDRIATLSLGVRVHAGMQHERMGRYGAALPAHTRH